MEPLRTRLYPVLAAIVGLLVAYGAVEGQVATLWLALAATVLGVPAVESARSKVTPTARLTPPQ